MAIRPPTRRRRRPGRDHRPPRSAWQVKYEELLSQAREAHDQHLEERVRLQAALSSAVNAKLTEENFIEGVQVLEHAIAIITKVAASIADLACVALSARDSVRAKGKRK